MQVDVPAESLARCKQSVEQNFKALPAGLQKLCIQHVKKLDDCFKKLARAERTKALRQEHPHKLHPKAEELANIAAHLVRVVTEV